MDQQKHLRKIEEKTGVQAFFPKTCFCRSMSQHLGECLRKAGCF